MKTILKKSYKKVFLSLALVATGIVTVASFLQTLVQNESNVTPITNSQDRVQSYKKEQAITGKYTFEDEILLENEISNLNTYVGQDIAKIIPKKVFSSNKSSYSYIERPYTGIYVQVPPSQEAPYKKTIEKTVNNTITNEEIVANAYDYVNLRWVNVSTLGDEFVIEPIFNAPPPGLFANNQWPSLQPTGNRLNVFFPTKSIADTVGLITRLGDEFTEDDWYEKTNVLGLELNFANLNLSDVSELFNPNLIWGFGLVDLIEDSTENGAQKRANDKREILYKGLTSLDISSNVLRHLPNPNYNNMPALRAINAGFNRIEAVGDFATYASEWSPLQNQDDASENSYFLYLDQLIKGVHKDKLQVVEIKKYLEQLSKKENVIALGETVTDKITNQYTFAYHLSRNPFTNSTRPPLTSDYNALNKKLLNVYQVFFNVNKALYKLSLNNNQIEQLPAFKFRITILDVSNNKLKYVPPIKFQPLPINYLTDQRDYTVQNFRNSAHWDNIHSLATPSHFKNYTNGALDNFANSYSTTALPEYSFFGNQILDFWSNINIDFNTSEFATTFERTDPNKNKFTIDWVTWPSVGNVSSRSTYQRLVDELLLAPTYPFHRTLQIENGIQVTRDSFVTRNWFTLGTIGSPGFLNDIINTGSAANLLAGLNPQSVSFVDCDTTQTDMVSLLLPGRKFTARGVEGCWVRAGIDLYGYKFSQKTDLISSIGTQNFNGTIFYKKDKPFLLPNFYTNTLKFTNSRNFTQEDANKSYYNMAPYLFGRFIPSNFSYTLNGFDDRKINLSFRNELNQELAPTNARSYTWEELAKGGLGTSKSAYWPKAKANSGNSPATKDLYYYNTWTGYIPYNPDAKNPSDQIFTNPQLDFTTNQAGNNPNGVPVETFTENSRFFDLEINQIDLNINYSWRINVVNEEDNPTATVKHGGILSLDNTPILKRAFLQEASDHNFLISNLSEWLNADPYVEDFILRNPSSVKIIDINEEKSSISVGFNVINWNGNKLAINDIELIGFNKLQLGVYDQTNDTVFTSRDEIRNFLITKAGFVEDIDTNKTWIKQYFVTNIPGLDLVSGNNNKTISWWKNFTGQNVNTPTLAKSKGFYTFNEIDDKYISDVIGNPGGTNLTFIFNLQVAKSETDFAVLNIQSFNFDFFKELIIGFDANDLDRDSSIQVLKAKIDNNEYDQLQQNVTFQTSKLNADGTFTKSAVEKAWTNNTTIEDLITTQKLPKKTNIRFDNFSYSVVNGNFSFNVIFEDVQNSAKPVSLTVSPVFADGFNLKATEYSWKTGRELSLANVNFIDVSATDWTGKSTFEIYEILKAKFLQGVNSTPIVSATGNAKKDFSEFNSLMGRILQYQETDNRGLKDSNFNTRKDFNDSWKTDIAITFNPNQLVNHETVNNLTEADFTSNIFYDADRLSINFRNVVVTGAYNYGYFYTPWENDTQFTPSFLLPDNNLIFAPVTTTPVGFSLTPSQHANFFNPAIEAWKQLIPSQWFQKLIEAQINSSNDTTLNYSDTNLETAIGFLNHLLYSNTSTHIYQTRAIIENVSTIQIDDLAGEVVIPANTIKILNSYDSSGIVINTPIDYTSEIKFTIKGLFDDGGPEFWNTSDFVNENISAMSVEQAKETLQNMFDSANKLYNNPNITGTELGDAYSAISALINFFVQNDYKNNDALSKFFIEKFTNTNANNPQTNSFTKFSQIVFSNENNFDGKLTITVTVENYIKGYNKATKKFEFNSENEKIQTFNLTNLERALFSPIWKKPNENDGTLNEQTSPFILILNSWNTKTVAEFLEELKTQAVNGYIDLYQSNNSSIGDITKWVMLDSFGEVSNTPLSQSEQENANAIFAATQVRVKVDDLVINADKTLSLRNVVVHIKDPTDNQFQDYFYNPNNAKLDSDNNISLFSIQDLRLAGFKNEPAEVVINSAPVNVLKMNNAEPINIDSILPSELFLLLRHNINDEFFINSFLSNYLLLSGSQSENHFLTLGFSETMITDLINNSNIQNHIVYNDGLGTFSININSLVVNNPYIQGQEEQFIGALPVTQFLVSHLQNQVQVSTSVDRIAIRHLINNDNFLQIKNMKLENTQIFVPNSNNPVVKVASDIKEATSQFTANDYAIIRNILRFSNIVTNDNDSTDLKIMNLIPNYENGSIRVEFAVENYYNDGILHKTFFGSFDLNWNFTSPIRLFLMIGLPIILGTLITIVLTSVYLHYNFWSKTNTKKISKKQLTHF